MDIDFERALFNDRDFALEQLRHAQAHIREQRRYIAELEKQLDHCVPGIVEEVREFLEMEKGR